jgi:hypothetical protein
MQKKKSVYFIRKRLNVGDVGDHFKMKYNVETEFTCS